MVLRDFIDGYRTADFALDEYDTCPTQDSISECERRDLERYGFPIEAIERLNFHNDTSLDGIAYSCGGVSYVLVGMAKHLAKKGQEYVQEIKEEVRDLKDHY